jgi:hypothetical protein
MPTLQQVTSIVSYTTQGDDEAKIKLGYYPRKITPQINEMYNRLTQIGLEFQEIAPRIQDGTLTDDDVAKITEMAQKDKKEDISDLGITIILEVLASWDLSYDPEGKDLVPITKETFKTFSYSFCGEILNAIFTANTMGKANGTTSPKPMKSTSGQKAK